MSGGGVSPSLYTSPTRAIFAISLSLSFAPLQNLELVDGTLDAPESHLVALCPTHVESALRDGVGWRMAVVAHQRCCGCWHLSVRRVINVTDVCSKTAIDNK